MDSRQFDTLVRALGHGSQSVLEYRHMMTLPVYEMANAAERKRLDRAAEWGWQIEQAATRRSRPSPGPMRRVLTLFGSVLRRPRQAWNGDATTAQPDIAPAISAASGNDARPSGTAWQQPSPATGD